MAQLVVWGPSWGVASVDPESLSVLVRSRTTCSTPRSAASSILHTSLHTQPHFPRFIIFLTSSFLHTNWGKEGIGCKITARCCIRSPAVPAAAPTFPLKPTAVCVRPRWRLVCTYPFYSRFPNCAYFSSFLGIFTVFRAWRGRGNSERQQHKKGHLLQAWC